jgi:hypothetical protein
MRISMQSGARSELLSHSNWSVGIVGGVVDDRGDAARAFTKGNSAALHTLRYLPDPPGLEFDGHDWAAEEMESILSNLTAESILLEATTLGFVEILLTCRALKDLGGSQISILYTEPKRYKRPRESLVLHRRDFELSSEVEGFSGVPGSVFMLREDRPTKAVFLVGYEGQRLEQALEQTGVRPSDCSIVFGVPAFQAGWEMDSFANNIRILRQRDVTGEILFGGAQSPQAAYSAIQKVNQSCDRDRGERLIIAPIGTKPHGIGAALFACNHPDVGIIYDHPHRSQGRTNAVSTWHLFDISF